jgi:DNA mismatch endonuclease (patch repair protein)
MFGGVSRPSPPPSSYVAQRTMEANRRSNTTPERLLRSELHARGLRYRVDRRIDLDGRRVRPDLVFGPARVAVFVDGCYWHRCPIHATHPVSNAEFWQAKFDRNVERDRADDKALTDAGWTVVRVWEHEEPAQAAARIESALHSRRPGSRVTSEANT